MNTLEILFEDGHLLVVNKPADLLSVPGRGPDKQDSIVNRALRQRPQVLVVHRLDCATSGVMLMALTKAAQSELSRQFREREPDKTYQAITRGQVFSDAGEIDLPLITDWPNRPRQKICYEQGKPSLTRYRLLGPHPLGQRLQLEPVTGRSHQLRVHCLALGAPIIGDRLYAPTEIAASAPRLLLHAHTLQIQHPDTDERLQFEAPLPF